MTIFVTGGTGYLGSYVITRLLEQHDDRLLLMVRAKNRTEAITKLWSGLQLHLDAAQLRRALDRIDFVRGDLTAPSLGITGAERERVADSATSVLHIAASLNRKSEKACLNANLRGTLNVIQLARDIERGRGGLERFSHVSTVAVCGHRDREDVTEDGAVDWDRSDYDPYGRTKKFCEHMVRELLPNVRKTFFRPSIVMGDSRHPRTTQFDMVRAFCVLADMPFLPMREGARLDIVNADFVGRAIADLHVKKEPRWDTYHLSSGRAAQSAKEIGEALLSRYPSRRPPRFVPFAERPFGAIVDRMASLPKSQVALIGSLLKVFLPYITFDTVFVNDRVCEELGETPVPFTEYCGDLYAWAKSVDYTFPHEPLPASIATEVSQSAGAGAWA
ncbi:MAG: SDR family oxidoreductase [Myxococcota bacterium]|nr:SDR family oxidoreductase [Myxococcota bacterium]